ncbi:TonB-dependent receptor domain-containing protein [uncultured Desulfobacter sp.]|uniref:TonB-dependent receptor n=1 Tax=uncultured Desulfobacter sp. TaxID=240139 RepID=UPI002AA649AC|nr:TonB-dependent receptor [uncultured Desulfobacter sp.]
MSRFWKNRRKGEFVWSAPWKMFLIIGLWSFFQPCLLPAQDMDKSNPGTDEKTQIETITVTAQKQEENIQEVPISISVFNDQAVEDRKIESLSDVADFVPNLVLGSNSGGGNPSMRGMRAPGESLKVSTGMYIDGVPVLSVLGYQNPILDIERVEVLRGPQGTLYGKNAEAGVINIVTRQPDNEFRGKISVQGNKYLSAETGRGLGSTASLLVSTPILEDRLFAGFSGKFSRQEGYIENISTDDTANDHENYYGRVHLRWTPTDQLDLSLIAAHTELDDDGWDSGLSKSGASSYGFPFYGYRKVASNYDESNTSTDSSQALKLTYDFNDAFQLTSVTSRRVYKKTKKTDFDSNTITKWHSNAHDTYTKIAQEVRLNYQKDKLQWLVGLFYDYDDDNGASEMISESKTKVNDTDTKGSSCSIFTNLVYPLFDALNMVGGLRYESQDKEKIDNIKNLEWDGSWDSITPKLALEYFFSPSIMSYISATKGFLSGGFNSDEASDGTYDEEELWSYEIGMKSAFWDNRLVVNAAAYYMDIEDMQVIEYVTPSDLYLTNAAEAGGFGFELEVTARLFDGLSVVAGFGYNHIEFDTFEDANGNYEGNMATYAPEYTFNIGAQYRHRNGFYARADLIGYDKMYTDYENTYKRDAYQVVNVKIGYETDRYDIYLYGKNIFDEEYDTVDKYYISYSEPGAIGLQLTYRF